MKLKIVVVSPSTHLTGMAESLAKASKIHKVEHSIRKKLANKGLVTKVGFDDIRGHSEAILRAREKAHRYGKTSFNVLITGESGTECSLGKMISHNHESFSAILSRISSIIEEYLAEYEWPGNIRELDNLVKQCFVLFEELESGQMHPLDIVSSLLDEEAVGACGRGGDVV